MPMWFTRDSKIFEQCSQFPIMQPSDNFSCVLRPNEFLILQPSNPSWPNHLRTPPLGGLSPLPEAYTYLLVQQTANAWYFLFFSAIVDRSVSSEGTSIIIAFFLNFIKQDNIRPICFNCSISWDGTVPQISRSIFADYCLRPTFV